MLCVQTFQTLRVTCQCWKKQRHGWGCQPRPHVETVECQSAIGLSSMNWPTVFEDVVHLDSSLMVNVPLFLIFFPVLNLYLSNYLVRSTWSTVIFAVTLWNFFKILIVFGSLILITFLLFAYQYFIFFIRLETENQLKFQQYSTPVHNRQTASSWHAWLHHSTQPVAS